MNFYTVPIKQVTDANGMVTNQPDIPDGTPFVGHYDGKNYFIATPIDLSGWSKATKHERVFEIDKVCRARGLTYNDVIKWQVGGS